MFVIACKCMQDLAGEIRYKINTFPYCQYKCCLVLIRQGNMVYRQSLITIKNRILLVQITAFYLIAFFSSTYYIIVT